MSAVDGTSRLTGPTLVWALTDLLVESGPGMNIYELYRREAGELAARQAEQAKPKEAAPNPAPGSVEWQQLQNKRDRDEAALRHWPRRKARPKPPPVMVYAGQHRMGTATKKRWRKAVANDG